MKVSYKNHYGSDLEVVNSARVSFSGESEWEYTRVDRTTFIESVRGLKPKDKHLIKFLARGCTTDDWEGILDNAVRYGYNTLQIKDSVVADEEQVLLIELLNHVKRMPSHWVPFANGGHIKMHFKVPLFVARQLQKHTAGFNPWSEVSRRYVDSGPELYEPKVWRGRSEDKKQGSTGAVDQKKNKACNIKASVHNRMSLELYNDLLKTGVAPEQARMVLPQSMYTEFVWSGNLYAWASLYNTRSWGDSQAETANVAQQIKAIVEPLFPVSWKELTQ